MMKEEAAPQFCGSVVRYSAVLWLDFKPFVCFVDKKRGMAEAIPRGKTTHKRCECRPYIRLKTELLASDQK